LSCQIYSHAASGISTIRRAHAAQIQLDGELLDAGTHVTISVLPLALTVLVPATE